MYDTLIMLRPEAAFTLDALHTLVRDVVREGTATVERVEDCLRVRTAEGSLSIVWNAAPHVLEESNELGEEFGVPTGGCRARFEMSGDDPGMELFNDYLLINERLQATGKFVLFDLQEGKLLFE